MTVESKKSGTDLAQSGTDKNVQTKKTRRGKDHVDYWKSKVTKRIFEWDGEVKEIGEWQIRIGHLGRREWFNLHTANKAEGAARAREIYLSVVGQGWESALKKFKPECVVPERTATVGEFLAEVKAVSHLKPATFEIYSKKFRCLLSGVFGLRDDKFKCDYFNGGSQKWVERIHRIRLDKLTPLRIQKWVAGYLKVASENPLKLKRAHVSTHSLIRNSKSLFAPRIRRFLTVKLPTPLPFDGVECPKLPRSRYKSKINPRLLLVQAKSELSETAPELYKIFLLALCAGLRRDEIDTLTWRQINWDRNSVSIETNIHTAAKSADSEDEVDVDPVLTEIFRGYLAKSQSEFVVNSTVAPRPGAITYHHYRCGRHFKKLIRWLRSRGVEDLRAIHTLRKEFGSQIAADGGIFAASLALRHSSIQLTRESYLDKKKVTVFKVSFAPSS